MRLVRKVASNDAASKFKSMQANARVLKHYRHKLLDAMTKAIQQSFENAYERDADDMLALIDNMGWIYKDLIRIEGDVVPLFPPDYEIYAYLVKAYHRILNETMRSMVASNPEARSC